MQSENVKTLFLAWQAPDRQWFPVGRLVADTAHQVYEFDYIKGALNAKESGFTALLAFPDFDKHYCASELFPLFQNRVLPASRKGFSDYIESLGLNPDQLDVLDILAVTGGGRQTDSFEVFPKMEVGTDGAFQCRFFMHGLRYVNQAGLERARTLAEGEKLQILLELNNPKTGLAISLSSNDYLPLGWTPRYLVSDLLRAMPKTSELSAVVIKVNSDSTPLNRRYLVEMTGKLQDDFTPMAGQEFQPIHH
ncbi:MAG: hypothetical protein COA63_007870 [Methylophaga sp.]|nr:hypothetical protein [Methylophaga sp.]